jgi:hypothetical protein
LSPPLSPPRLLALSLPLLLAQGKNLKAPATRAPYIAAVAATTINTTQNPTTRGPHRWPYTKRREQRQKQGREFRDRCGKEAMASKR